MKTEQSQSQIQEQKKMPYTSTPKYNNTLAQAVHDSQQVYGLEKYGITLDEVPTEKYDWQLMAIEESVDMNQYLTRECRRLHEDVEYWKRLEAKTMERLTKKNEKLEEENEELKERLKELQFYVDQIEGAKKYGSSD
jgi:hypothetical protein